MAPDQPFNRPPRVRPRWAAEMVELPEPPATAPETPLDWLQLTLPLAGAGIFAGAATLTGGNPLLVALPTGAMAMLGIGAGLFNQRRARRRSAAEYAERRALFEDRLEGQRTRLRRLHDQEVAARRYLSPDLHELLLIAGAEGANARPEPRLWERRIGDDDFLELRVGSGNLPAASQGRVPPPARDAPVDRRLYRTAAEYATLRQVPIAVPLAGLGSLGVAGARPAVAALVRALLWQAATLHSPGDLRIAALFSPGRDHEWEWLRWLPHTVPLNNDTSPAVRMVAGESAAAARLTSDLLDHLSRRRERAAREQQTPLGQRLLLLIDGPEQLETQPAIAEVLRHGAALGMLVLLIAPTWPELPEACSAMLELDDLGARWVRAGEAWPRERFVPDQAELVLSDRIARRLAGIRVRESGGAQDIPRSVRLFELLGIAAAADLARPHWWDTPPSGAWRPDVPIGAVGDGQPLFLDLNESRHGPHGIIAGATGAGKSVLLQSIIAALAVTHGPERLQLLLIDFKGGAALMMFEPLPHTTGMVTDLEGRMAERAMIAITSELRRRKRLLKDLATQYGEKVENIADYRALAARRGLPPLPNLLIVVDEFDEMARGYPEFVAELIRVVKQGRSLGVHLLLATQQPARAVTDEIRSQLKYFVALRLGGAEDSREMLLKPDAAFLPTDIPGRAFFRVGSDVRMLQVAQVNGPFRSTTVAAGPRVSFVRDGREHLVVAHEQRPLEQGQTDLDVLVRSLQEAAATREPLYPGWSPAQIWQPPLPPWLALSEVDREALCETCWGGDGSHGSWLRQPVGLLDLPQESRREAFAIALADGHGAVVGAPGSGKTTLLRTLILGLALRYSPRDLWCYLIDAGGQGLSPLAGLPHVGAHIQARERERVRRLIALVDGMIRERQDRLRAADAVDLLAYRLRTGEALPAVLLVIDKIAVLREEFRDGHGDGEVLDDLLRIARLGRPLGIHLVISADRAADLSYRLLALLETRIALRQPELHDYSELLGVRVTAQISTAIPGRALIAHQDYGALDLQIALPVREEGTLEAENGSGSQLDADLVTDLRALAATLSERWQSGSESADGPTQVELLPERIPLAELIAVSGSLEAAVGLNAPIGRESLSLGPAWLRLDRETPHALVIGPRRSGKTQALLAGARSLAARYDSTQLQILVFDGPRLGLAELRALPHLTFYGSDEQGASELKAALDTPNTGARRLVLIDDYIVCRERNRAQFAQSYGEANLFAALCELAQLGGERGDHLVLAATLSYADDPLLRALDGARAGVVLWPGRYDSGTRLLGASLPLAAQRGLDQPPGRALLVREDELQLVQLARA